MILYYLGVFITMGFLMGIDSEGEFDGWRGGLKALFIAFIWPVFLGCFLGRLANDEDN